MSLELDLTTTDPIQRIMRRQAELEKRIVNLERERFGVPVNAGAPVSTDGSSGSLAGDTTNTRLWVKLGSTWRYVVVT